MNWCNLFFVALLATVAHHFQNKRADGQRLNKIKGNQARAPMRSQNGEEALDCGEQFTCQINNACIPIEWRCDFIEQCLDGQDEFDCPSERCDFGRDLCNWHKYMAPANPRSNHSSGADDLGTQNTIPKPSYIQVWNRYSTKSVARLRKLAAHKQTASSSEQSLHVQLLDRCNLLSESLRDLGARHSNGNFAYVPLLLELPLRAEPGESVEASSYFLSSYLGRTRSTCRLEFRYSVASHLSNASWWLGHPFQLYLRVLAKRANSVREPTVLWQRGVAGNEWRRRTGQWVSSRLLGEWTQGVVELGQLEQTQLYFQVQLNLDYEKQQNEPLRYYSRPAWLTSLLLEQTRSNRTDLNFRSCRWPKSLANPSAESSVYSNSSIYESNYLLNADSLEEPLEESSQHSASNNSSPTVASELEEINCSDGEFRCSNDVCIPNYHLCNHVDDCMVHQRAKSGHLKGEDESDELCLNIAGKQDFEEEFPFRSDYQSMKHKIESLFRIGSFWTLSGSWPATSVSVKNSLSKTAYLPRQDHTLEKPKGHYLSLRVPNFEGPRGEGSKTNTSIYWLYLNSPWMIRSTEEPEWSRAEASLRWPRFLNVTNSRRDSRKERPSAEALRGELAKEECRVKFFYNLVVDYPELLEQKLENLPFRLYLAAEHFVVKGKHGDKYASVPERTITSNKLAGFQEQLSRLNDMFIYSELADPANLNPKANIVRLIELPGIDFWREANFVVSDLKEGDIFQTRLAIIVEQSRQSDANANRPNVRASLNLDDLASHFGCQQLKDSAVLKRLESLSSSDQLDPIKLNLSDYVARKSRDWARRYIPRMRRDQFQASDEVQFEPQKLVIYVLGLLFCILGFILLIVFVTVPYVERLTINYHDQLNLGSSDIDTTPENSFSQHLEYNCQLAIIPDIAARRRARQAPASSNSPMETPNETISSARSATRDTEESCVA